MHKRTLLVSAAAAVGALGGWLWGRATVTAALTERLPAARLDWLDTPYGRACLYRRGEGPTVLLLHSFNAAASAYEVAPLFDDLAADHHVVALDWPGFGRSERTTAWYTAAGYQRTLATVIEQIAPAGEPIDIVALSLGGQYAATIAAARPGRFRRLALISPTGFAAFGRKPGSAFRTRLIRSAWLGQPFYTALTTRPALGHFLGQLFAVRQRLPDALIDAAWEVSHQHRARFAPASFTGGQLNDPHARAAYQRLTVPTLLLFGDQARFSDPAAARTMAAGNPYLRFRQINDCGDLPHFEQRAATTRLVRAFLAATPVSEEADSDGRWGALATGALAGHSNGVARQPASSG